jgi:hypothetical protein
VVSQERSTRATTPFPLLTKEGNPHPAFEALGRRFGQLVEEAKVRLGGLFRSDDYPAPEELCPKFSFETKARKRTGASSC